MIKPKKNNKGNAWLIVLAILGVFALILLMFLGWISGTYNGLVKSDVNVEKNWG